MTTPTHTDIPLSKLKLSPTNARHDPGDVTTLANSIRSVGLISALAVTRNGSGWLVEAGGRRLAALHQLRDAGHIPKDEPIPCMVFDTPSLARSLAENHERAPMDAVQQFQAFARLVGEGRSLNYVAEAFSVTVQFVRQRIKLATLVPEVIDAYRQGRCNLEQMAALTFGTPEQQRAIVADPHIPGAFQLRERLRGKVIPSHDRRVKFVGIDAYEDAGGRTITDLFASTEDLVDEDVLDRLVAEKLQGVADVQLAAGRSFAVVVDASDFHHHKAYESVPAQYAPTEAQVARLEQLGAEMEALHAELDDTDADGEPTQAQAERMEKLEQEMEQIEAQASRPSIGADVPIGVLVALEWNGRVGIREVIRAEDAKVLRQTQGPQTTGTSGAKPAPAGREELSKSGVVEIAQHRQAGLALKVAESAQLALALVVQAWDIAIFGGIKDDHPGLGRVPMFARPTPWLGDLRPCPTDKPPELSEQLRAITSRPAADRRRPYLIERQGSNHIPLSWYIDQPKQVLLEILAHCVAHALCDPDSSERNGVADVARESIADLADASEFVLADVWQPTPEWLKGYGKAKTLAALRQIGALGEDAALTKGKASDIYAAAAPMLAEKRWVPEYGITTNVRGVQ